MAPHTPSTAICLPSSCRCLTSSSILPAVPPCQHIGELLQGEPLQRRLARARMADDRHFHAGGGVHRRHLDGAADLDELEEHLALAGHSPSSAKRASIAAKIKPAEGMPMSELRAINPPGWVRPKGYSHAIVARGTQVFVA